MLKVESITKHYGSKAVLSDISFELHQGDVAGLVGENGAGKSTLLNILSTLTPLEKGQISYHGQSYGSNRLKLRKQIGFVPQDIAVWEEFSVEENMVFFERLSWGKKSKKELKQLCLDMHLEKWKEKVQSLSGGMKRKLNIAISLIHDPEIILLDEPTVGIDLKSRKEIGAYLHRLAKKQGKIIIYTSHDMEEIMSLCDCIYSIGGDPFYKQLLEDQGKTVYEL
ncbi:ABC transporter ATP-binding protein [Sediminibacillus albus]|uniref:ABC-2 type transport system ATP-binding protein n=1 Tax=Sediminibacillus albus TaxID=407036 RepID=A0A1G8Y3K4_9BACI|nr:ABC transporter ATP-binding protein [Sediminibacillus albus]SDJ97361.1 ABC-2 type transport system ATP-binding protein [Sediminibacillus albus]